MKALLVVLASILPATCQQTYVTLDTNASRVNFTLPDVLHMVRGTFHLTDGKLWFDPSSGKASGRLTVDAASGNSANHARDSRMVNDVLQAGQYRVITFTPDRIDGRVNNTGHSDFRLHGLFAIHGATHDLTMNVKSDIQADRLRAQANFDVPYVEWGMKNPSMLMLRVSKTVQIEVLALGSIIAAAQNAATASSLPPLELIKEFQADVPVEIAQRDRR